MTTKQTWASGTTPSNTAPAEDSSGLVARRDALLGPAYRLMYQAPLEVVRSEGAWLFDQHGQAYLDAYNNVACVGHCHPAVVAALTAQASTLSTNTRYLHRTVLDYAEKLLAYFPDDLGQVMFTCTGSEANDLAIRVAEAATGGTGVVITENAYHGVTHTTAGLSPSLGPEVGLGHNVRSIPAPGGHQGSQTIAERFAQDVQRAIEDMRQAGIRPSALIVDSVFSSDGILTEPAGFLAAGVKAMRDAGGLFIADEVQAGFGRPGGAMWGFARHGIAPDLVTLGKPMGNGYPLAGLVARPELLRAFGRKTRYFNTLGGNTVAAAVGLAVLEVLEQDGLMANADAVGGMLHRGLATLARRHPCIGDVRGIGLFLGVELRRGDGAPDPRTAAQVVNALRERHILISATGPRSNILKIRPPLVFSADNATLFLDTFDAVLSRL